MINILLSRLRQITRSANPIPAANRQAVNHLYWDIGWFGIVSGTTIAFLAVFATRQGASTTQIGLMSAVPALINLLFALPAGSWLSKRPLGNTVFWTSVFTRAFYLVYVPLPVLLMPNQQVWMIILVTLLMTIPSTALVVGFNAQFADVIPAQWRGHVAGIRNAISSVVTTLVTLLSGQVLENLPFPLGYQVVFAFGFLGAAMSSYHLYHLSRIHHELADAQPKPITQVAKLVYENGNRLSAELNQLYRRGVGSLRLDVLSGTFARIMGLLFFWHTVHFLTIPVVTPFIVNQLRLSDQTISLAGGLFNGTVFAGSLLLGRFSHRFGNKRLTGAGMVGTSAFPIFTSFGGWGYLTGNFLGGIAWSMAGGSLYNYILDNVPAHDRPAYIAWYNLISNGAILIGSLSGPFIAGQISIPTALLLFGVLRMIAGLALLRWG